MPLDPIHTLRAARRLHLKDGVFLSLAPPGVFGGHLRAVNGRIGWLGPASAVERGEEVLECWRQVVIPGLPMAGVDPLAVAARAVPAGEAAAVRARLEALGAEDHKSLAAQAFVECATLGVLLPIVDLRGASAARARGTAEALAEVGLRGVFEWDAETQEKRAAAEELGASELLRCVLPSGAPRIDVGSCARGEAAPADGILSSRGGPPDAFSLVRILERRERGLGFRCLANTYAIFTSAFGAPFGAFSQGAFFDVVFLDYETPARLERNNIEAFFTEGLGPWCVEASAVATQPVMRRHDVITADREAIANRVAEIVARART